MLSLTTASRVQESVPVRLLVNLLPTPQCALWAQMWPRLRHYD